MRLAHSKCSVNVSYYLLTIINYIYVLFRTWTAMAQRSFLAIVARAASLHRPPHQTQLLPVNKDSGTGKRPKACSQEDGPLVKDGRISNQVLHCLKVAAWSPPIIHE